MHHRLAVVIPFRDRERHLKSFLSQANPYIAAQVTEFRVFIVEQDFGEHFNRGLLMNIGFLVRPHLQIRWGVSVHGVGSDRPTPDCST